MDEIVPISPVSKHCGEGGRNFGKSAYVILEQSLSVGNFSIVMWIRLWVKMADIVLSVKGGSYIPEYWL